MIKGWRIFKETFYEWWREQIDWYWTFNKARTFNNEKALFTYYYNHVLPNGSVVFNDARLLDRPLIDCENDIKRILMFHSNHIQGNKVCHSYKLALDKQEIIDKYIVLTEYQNMIFNHSLA